MKASYFENKIVSLIISLNFIEDISPFCGALLLF